ncbi:MAG: glycosyltransferase, partial [Tagaea sp.]
MSFDDAPFVVEQARARQARLPHPRAQGFDMVHAHTPVAALAGRPAAKAAGVARVVYTAHGFDFHDNMPAPKRALHEARDR